MKTKLLLSSVSALVLGSALACSAPSGSNSKGDDNSGDDTSSGTGSSSGDFQVDDTATGGTTAEDKECNPPQLVLNVAYRDFDEGGDFEMSFKGDVVRRQLVESALGSDKKPVFKSSYGCPGDLTTALGCYNWTIAPPDYQPSIGSADTFNQWYRDTDGVNMHFDKELILLPDAAKPGVYSFSSSAFFPLTIEEGFGKSPDAENPNNQNFLFTTEIHIEFGYETGQKFTFSGDDDVWVFVNGKLALDLGSMHGESAATIDFDAQAADLGIVAGGTYPMDVFHAERHTSGSNFRIETNIGCVKNIVVPVN